MKIRSLVTIAFAGALAALASGQPKISSPGGISSADYPSIQAALDANPGRLVYVPAGDHVVERAVRVMTANGGLWGAGRIIQNNPKAAIVEVANAPGAQVRDLILTRADGVQDTDQAGLAVTGSPGAVVANVTVINNWSAKASILFDGCDRMELRDCLVRDYGCIAIDDRTEPGSNSGVVFGYAFRCINGTGINILRTRGGLIVNNRIVENRLPPTPEIKEKYQLGKFVKKNAQKGDLVPQATWDAEYVNIWRQGSALHVGSGKTSDYLQILGNYVENAQQGFDIQGDHVILANNIVTDAGHGMKATHGSRNTLISGNQFAKVDLWGIGLMAGLAAHEAGRLPSKGPAAVGENVPGYSIVAHNIISDFGFGKIHWNWPASDRIGPAPIQFEGNGIDGTPVLRDVIINGNVTYNPGSDGILVDGHPQVEKARYRFAVKVETGKRAPVNLQFSNNLFDPGLEGEMNDHAAKDEPATDDDR